MSSVLHLVCKHALHCNLLKNIRARNAKQAAQIKGVPRIFFIKSDK